MVHECNICEKELTKTEYKDSDRVGTYIICPDCQKYFSVEDSSIPKYDKWTKLVEISKRFKYDQWFERYIEAKANSIMNSMTEEEKADVDRIKEQKNEEVLDKQRSESATSFEKKIKNDIVLVTTDFVTGHTIKQMLGPVSGCTAFGAGMIKSYLASLSATLGTKSNSFSSKFSETRVDAEMAMLEEAKTLGANAVIDVHYAISNFAADLTGILVTGTAVVIE